MTTRPRTSPFRSLAALALALTCPLLTHCQAFKSSWESIKADVNRGHYKESKPMGRYIME